MCVYGGNIIAGIKIKIIYYMMMDRISSRNNNRSIKEKVKS
jgi:hypothetical protein